MSEQLKNSSNPEKEFDEELELIKSSIQADRILGHELSADKTAIILHLSPAKSELDTMVDPHDPRISVAYDCSTAIFIQAHVELGRVSELKKYGLEVKKTDTGEILNKTLNRLRQLFADPGDGN